MSTVIDLKPQSVKLSAILVNRYSYFNEKCAVKELNAQVGLAVLAKEIIYKNELVASWNGKLINKATVDKLSQSEKKRILKIDENYYDFSEKLLPQDCINHSCDPNLGFNEKGQLVAIRDIRAGEELCFDYAMSDSDPIDEFKCECGSRACRKIITGEDWRIKSFQRKYGNYLMPYLRERVS